MVGFLLRRAGLLAVVAICGLHAAAAGSAAAATVVANT